MIQKVFVGKDCGWEKRWPQPGSDVHLIVRPISEFLAEIGPPSEVASDIVRELISEVEEAQRSGMELMLIAINDW